MTRRTAAPAGRPPAEGRCPRPGQGSQPVATPAPANRKLELQREAVRRSRARERRGETTLLVDGPFARSLEFLLREGYLTEEDWNDKAAIRIAASRAWLDTIIRSETR